MTQVIRTPADVIDDALTEATNDLQPEAGRIDLEGVSRSIIVGDGSPAEMIVSEAQNQNGDGNSIRISTGKRCSGQRR